MMILIRYEYSGNAERTVEWLFNHPDDSGENATFQVGTPARVPDLRSVPAKYQLMAFISHKRPLTHYVELKANVSYSMMRRL